MTARRILPAATAALAVVLVAGCSAAAPQAGGSSATQAPSSSASTTASASPSGSAAPSGASSAPTAGTPVNVPVVAPTLRALHIDGPGYEQNLTGEDSQARDAIYRSLPTLLNEASHRYSSPIGARDELASQGLITQHMASTFPAEFTPEQKEVNATGFTVQTTGMMCSLRTGAGSALQTGRVFCYFSRHYVGPDGSPVTDSRWTTPGEPNAINPDELQNAVVTMVKEGGAWKVDGIQFGA
ncbi:hypothetical protein [Sinomonas sp.]|uniref:hypothetical protein n=1 Tax=Sinomonas sp. TaxID=1914986 RepID=UPI003F7EB369